jgi:hypothetical protein
MMAVPEWRSPQTGSTLIERIMLAALVPTSLLIWYAVWFGGRAIVALLS